jgi:nitroreductase
VSYNQAQVTECHTLYVFCARTDIQARIEEYISATGNETNKSMMEGFANHLKDPVAWASRQAYIALGFALAAAAEQRIASCPMEGFQSDGVSKVLDLPSNLVPCVALAVGEWTYAEDLPRFRFPPHELITDV